MKLENILTKYVYVKFIDNDSDLSLFGIFTTEEVVNYFEKIKKEMIDDEQYIYELTFYDFIPIDEDEIKTIEKFIGENTIFLEDIY